MTRLRRVAGLAPSEAPAMVPRRPRRHASRRGATLVLIAVMSSALVLLGAVVINWSYIELTSTQLRAATDATAKAAAVAMSQLQNQGDAKRAARDVARAYQIAGRPLRLRNSDIQFGNTQSDGAGGYTFSQGVQPLNSARVIARLADGSATSSVPVFFANMLPQGTFTLEREATAGRYDHDICVVVDRSASMAWDLSGVDFAYPPPFDNDSTLQNYFRPPQPGSRWAALIDALEVFKTTVDSRDLNPKIGLVSYASNYTFAAFSADRVTRNQLLSLNTQDFLDAAYDIGDDPIIGDTNIASGINNGRAVLVSASERRITANRTMILLSDGVRTEGGNPVNQATRCANARITVHTVSFGDGADQQVLDDIATETGGTHYHALTGGQLIAAFEDIAEQLPAVLTD